jgi:hypothetical protein
MAILSAVYLHNLSAEVLAQLGRCGTRLFGTFLMGRVECLIVSH